MNLLPKMEEVSILTFTLGANFKVAFQAPFFFACLSFLFFDLLIHFTIESGMR